MKSNLVQSTNKPPIFTVEHLKYLESVFPENTDVLTTENMYYKAGSRLVIKHIEHLILQAKKKQQELQQ